MSATPGYGALLDALRGLTWPARIRSRGAVAGTHPSRLRGQSAEFTEYRGYRQGDDPRRLDWKLLARTDRAYLRITTERSTLPTLIAVDGSASMAFPEPGASKWAAACQLAVGLAAVAHAAGDPVALAVSGTPPRRLPFRARRGTVADLARTLDGTPPGGGAELADALGGWREVGRLALLTDLLGDEAALRRLATEWRARGVDVILAHVVAREEIEPPATTRLAVDPERPDIHRPLSPSTIARYQEAFSGWRDRVAADWRAAGIPFVPVIADEAADRAVRRIVGTVREDDLR